MARTLPPILAADNRVMTRLWTGGRRIALTGNPFFVAAGRRDCYTRGEQSVLGKKGAGMKRHWSGQQGAILVLTAFLLPFIIAFTGITRHLRPWLGLSACWRAHSVLE